MPVWTFKTHLQSDRQWRATAELRIDKRIWRIHREGKTEAEALAHVKETLATHEWRELAAVSPLFVSEGR